LELPFRYPFVKSLIISLQDIEANHHTGDTQIVPLRWCRTGYGGHHRPRPLLVCQCGRSVTRVYFKGGHLACRRCCGATYASRQCDKRLRPILQAKRLQNFLQLKTYMSQRNRQRIKARIASAPQQELKSKRLAHHSIHHPQSRIGVDSGQCNLDTLAVGGEAVASASHRRLSFHLRCAVEQLASGTA
jgi:hypothetical protein